jgi:hypothetical protein
MVSKGYGPHGLTCGVGDEHFPALEIFPTEIPFMGEFRNSPIDITHQLILRGQKQPFYVTDDLGLGDEVEKELT